MTTHAGWWVSTRVEPKTIVERLAAMKGLISGKQVSEMLGLHPATL